MFSDTRAVRQGRERGLSVRRFKLIELVLFPLIRVVVLPIRAELLYNHHALVVV